MPQTSVSMVVAATSVAALGAAWTGITQADAHAAAVKAALAEQDAAAEVESVAKGPAAAEAPRVIVVSPAGGSGPGLAERLGAAPAVQLPPMAPLQVGTLGTGVAGATSAGANTAAGNATLVAAPAAPGVVTSAPSAAAAAPAVSAPAVAAAPAPAPAPKPAPAPAPAVKKVTTAS